MGVAIHHDLDCETSRNTLVRRTRHLTARRWHSRTLDVFRPSPRLVACGYSGHALRRPLGDSAQRVYDLEVPHKMWSKVSKRLSHVTEGVAIDSDEAGASIWNAERLRAASNAAGVALWSWNVDTSQIDMDQHAYALWGIAKAGPVTFERLSDCIHPADRARVRHAFEETRTQPGPYEIDFRISWDGQVRWISARGHGADEGILERVMFGTFMDVTPRKVAEETREMIAGEMSHRVKNLFTIASCLTAIAAKSAASTVEMARDLTQRLAALAGAHDLIHSDGGRGGHKGALLGDLFAVFLAPYDEKGIIGDRIHVLLPTVRVGETSTTTLALIVHELATNSIKYGSLSTAKGSLGVSCAIHDDYLDLFWTERGGPLVSAPTGSGGFGSKLLARSVADQLGGSIAYEWPTEGAEITLRISKARLSA